MSLQRLSQLSEVERNLVMDTPALVTVLIGGADDHFDKKEEERAKRAVHFRQTIGDPLLFEYFEEVEKTFDNVLQMVSEKYAGPVDERIAAISDELARLNNILPKIDNHYAQALLKNWRSLAHGVSQSSGGILGFWDESKKEKELIALTMITYQP